MERSHHVLSSPWVQTVLVVVLVLLQSANHGATAPISIRDCTGINLRPCYDGPPLRKSVVSLPRCCRGLEKILGRVMSSTHESTSKCICTALLNSSPAGPTTQVPSGLFDAVSFICKDELGFDWPETNCLMHSIEGPRTIAPPHIYRFL